LPSGARYIAFPPDTAISFGGMSISFFITTHQSVRWHGPSNKRFDKSVVDIKKVYASLFNVYGICEAIIFKSRFP